MKSRHMNAAVCSSAGGKIVAKLFPENRCGATTGCTRLMIKHFDAIYLTQSKNNFDYFLLSILLNAFTFIINIVTTIVVPFCFLDSGFLLSQRD